MKRLPLAILLTSTALTLLLVAWFSWLAACRTAAAQAAESSAEDTAESSAEDILRHEMVRSQIEARGIESPAVLAAMRKVPRHRFVPARIRSQAYQDRALPIGHDQTISQPYIVAFMTDALRLSEGHKVLEIGTGSGYQAAVLGELCAAVYTIEIVEPLARRSEELLQELGYANVHVRAGDGYRGWPEQAPFDAILVTAAPDHVPPVLIEQLKVGGRMILPVGSDWWQELIVLEKTASGTTRREVLPVRFVPMTGEAERR